MNTQNSIEKNEIIAELIKFFSDTKNLPENMIPVLESLTTELLNDSTIIEPMLKAHPMIYHHLPEKFQSNPIFAIQHLKHNSDDLPYSYSFKDLHPDLFKNQNFVLHLAAHYPIEDVHPYIDASIITKEFNFLLLDANHEAYEHLNKEDRKDPDYLDFIMNKYPQSLFFADKELQEDLKYLDILFHHPDLKKTPYGYVENEYEDWLEDISKIYFIKREQDWLEKNTPVNTAKSIKANKF